MNIKNIGAIYLTLWMLFFFSSSVATADQQAPKTLVYLVSDLRIPFWDIMARGIKGRADALGYKLEIYSAENSAQHELEFTVQALQNKVSGIIVSPTTSSACVTILALAKKAGVPVVIADVGTDGGDYVSYISSDNESGAYEIGKVLAKKMLSMGWGDGQVGIVAIPQKRLNGRLRTTGFMRAMNEAGIKGATIMQQSDFSEEETYRLSKSMIDKYPELRAIWLQGSNRYNGALQAIIDAGKKDQILLITFDAEPVFLELIPQGILVGSAMQQPYLMGQKAIHVMDQHLHGQSVDKDIKLPILAISTENIMDKLPTIKKYVLGL